MLRKRSCDSSLMIFQQDLSRIYRRQIQFHIQLEQHDFIATVRTNTSIVCGSLSGVYSGESRQQDVSRFHTHRICSHSYVYITDMTNTTQKLMHHSLMHVPQKSMHRTLIIYIQVLFLRATVLCRTQKLVTCRQQCGSTYMEQ